MSVMVDSITDQYPMETASFDILPQDSPISHLDYGGILSQIGEHVRQKRKENRVQRRDYLIKNINNVNLGIIIDKIKSEAQHLESYREKEWNKGPFNKENYRKFFISHDISLKYLEDMYIVQSKSPPKRPLPPWIIFAHEQRPIFEADNPEKSTTELTTLISREWRNMTDCDKKRYVDIAIVDKKRYMKEKEEYDINCDLGIRMRWMNKKTS
ncbi:hypothetical protein N8569_00035 [bacterium]|nr:hypothetical protein [bacterium]